jgi:ABC-2 type transport system permease protein
MFEARRGRAGFGGALRSEFTKIRSTPSTYWTLLALVVITIAIGALASFAAARNVDAGGRYFDPTNRSLDGLYLGQLIIAALGALTITSEYSTGMIRTSLTVMPRRGVVFAAKAVAFGMVAFVTGLVTSFGACSRSASGRFCGARRARSPLLSHCCSSCRSW